MFLVKSNKIQSVFLLKRQTNIFTNVTRYFTTEVSSDSVSEPVQIRKRRVKTDENEVLVEESLYPPASFAVVGSGPAGFYTVQRILKAHKQAKVDIFEKLPVPFGLVRFGVAPDHQETKAVQNQFNELLKDHRCRFFGNVVIGKDITVEELHENYTSVIYSIGSGVESHLNIKGEKLKGVFSAGEFVAWYSGHPDYSKMNFDLRNIESVSVIGMGNVALDVARILLKSVDSLNKTDIPTHILDQLAESKVREVHVIGRRGPLEAAFTNPELREIISSPECDWKSYIEPQNINFQIPSEVKERAIKRKVELLQQMQLGGHENHFFSENKKKLVFHFLRSPIEFIARKDNQEKLDSILLAHNKLEHINGSVKAVPTGDNSTLTTQTIFKSIGYISNPITGLPFDQSKNIIPNTLGRVLWENPTNEKNIFIPEKKLNRTYVAGWIKRGPTGIIGTNLWDATQTVDVLLEDLKKIDLNSAKDLEIRSHNIVKLLEKRNIKFVDLNGWLKIQQYEEKTGEVKGKVREKLVDVDQMIKVAYTT